MGRKLHKDAPLERRVDFQRQVTLLGDDGQRRVEAGRVLVVGLGGLGCPAARYLGAAGVGHLTLVDFDTVAATDLHRQILYAPGDEGRRKAELAATRLDAHGPGAVVGVHATFEASMVDGHEVVLDCTDEAGTRALIHQACMERGVPLAWAAVEGWEAQWAHVMPGKGPCLRCLWPSPGDAPSCADAGILGPTVAMAGAWQALAALRILAGRTPATGRLHLHDLAEDRHESIAFDARPDCPACAVVPK